MTISKAKVIKDYEKLSDELLERLKEEYPNGYSNYIIQFPNKAGKMVRAIELETEDTLYMIRLPESVSGIGWNDDIEVEEEDEDIIADEVFDDNFEVGSTVAIKDIEEEIVEDEEDEETFETEDKQESNEDEEEDFDDDNFDVSDEDFFDDDDDFEDDDFEDEANL